MLSYLRQDTQCYPHSSKCGLGVPYIDDPQHTILVSLIDLMCLRLDENDDFNEENFLQKFPSLGSVLSCYEDARRLTQCECSSYPEYLLTHLFILHTMYDHSDIQVLSRKGLYHVIVKRTLSNEV